MDTLDRRPNKKSNYVLLRSEQVRCLLNPPLPPIRLMAVINIACWDRAGHSRQI